MANNTDQVNSFLEREYARTSRILRNGELFSGIQNEEANSARTIENLKRTAEHHQMQQSESIKRKYQVKIDSLQNLQKKLMMYVNNPSMLKSDDISRISSMLGEMHQLLESQKNYEIETSNKEVETRSKKSIEDYSQRSQMVIEKHLQDAKSRLDSLISTFKPLEEYYETASFDSPLWSNLEVRSKFPSLKNIRIADTEETFHIADGKDLTYSVPEIIPFFIKKSLTIIYKSSERHLLKNVVDNLMIRSMMSAEAGNIQYYLIDGCNNGSLYFDFLKCDPRTLELFNGKLFVTSPDIESVLMKLQNEYNEIDQNIRKGEPIEMFNETHPKATIPYMIVVMDSFPKGINASFLSLIARLVKNELAAGLHFVFLVEEQDKAKITDLISLTEVFPLTPNMSVSSKEIILSQVLDYVSREYNREKTMLFEEYYDANVEWWKDTTANYTVIPLGMHHAENYNLTFNPQGKGGMSSANAIIIGTPGSGKSCLLHTMIVGSSIKYSPNELRFFLIDMKAVEFKRYAEEKMPHAEFVATNANPEFGDHILKVICRKLNERKRLLSQKNVTSYKQYRETYPNEILPRYMIFIDEYHELLSGPIKQGVVDNLEFIIREGRALGFNLILSSQSADLNADLINKISHRIVMRCETQDARPLLNAYDERTPLLNNGQAIIYASGRTNLVQSYYLPEDKKDKPFNAEKLRVNYLQMIRERWNEETKGQYEHNLVVFDRELPALLSNNKLYRKMSIVSGIVDVPFSPGEKIMIDGDDLMCKFNRSKNENLLVVGGKADISVRAVHGCLMSMLPQLPTNEVEINIVNLINLSQSSILKEIEYSAKWIGNRFKNATYVSSGKDIPALLDDIITDISRRLELLRDGHYVAPRFLVIYKVENESAFEELKKLSPLDKKVISAGKSELTKKLVQILEQGSEVGIHCLIHFSDPTSYCKVLDIGSNDRKYFNHRVLLQMGENYSMHFLDSMGTKGKAASELVNNNMDEKYAYNIALYYNAYDAGNPVKIKPYEFISNN